jgi:hypothetical protein
MFAQRRAAESCCGTARGDSMRPNTETRTHSQSMYRCETANPVRSNARPCVLPAGVTFRKDASAGAEVHSRPHEVSRTWAPPELIAGVLGIATHRFALVGAGHDRPGKTRPRCARRFSDSDWSRLARHARGPTILASWQSSHGGNAARSGMPPPRRQAQSAR